MRIATFLPHLGVFGGVRRFLELGNAWTAAGHEVTLYHPDGTAPDWLPYRGRVARLEAADGQTSDLAICADARTWRQFRSHRARVHLFYCVLEKDPALARALRDPAVKLAANSTPLRRALERRARRPVLDGVGGIDLGLFHPDPARRGAMPLRVLLNGRRSRPKKGTDLALGALRRLAGHTAPFEVVLFDSLGPGNERDPRAGARLPERARWVLNPTQEELAALYQSAHLFVAAERKAGWCNTALEAMACGCAVVCTPSGTTDFARHQATAWVVGWRHSWPLSRAVRRVLEDAPLRERLAQAGPVEAQRWSWDDLAAKLLAQMG
jgi:glycosyltransferase involved in cell wall biosynthesis